MVLLLCPGNQNSVPTCCVKPKWCDWQRNFCMLAFSSRKSKGTRLLLRKADELTSTLTCDAGSSYEHLEKPIALLTIEVMFQDFFFFFFFWVWVCC